MSAKDVKIFLRRIEMISNRIKLCFSVEVFSKKSTDLARITKIIYYPSSTSIQKFYVMQYKDVIFNQNDN
jgi:hypothetical protein